MILVLNPPIPPVSGDEKLVRVAGVKESGGVYVYQVTCLGVGETTVSLTVGNRQSPSLPRPVHQTSAIKVKMK